MQQDFKADFNEQKKVDHNQSQHIEMDYLNLDHEETAAGSSRRGGSSRRLDTKGSFRNGSNSPALSHVASRGRLGCSFNAGRNQLS